MPGQILVRGRSLVKPVMVSLRTRVAAQGVEDVCRDRNPIMKIGQQNVGWESGCSLPGT